VDFIEESLGFNEEDHEMCIITSLLCFQNSVSELSYQGDNAHLMVFFIETQGFFDKVLALRSDFLFCRLELLKVSVKVTCFEISSAENTTLERLDNQPANGIFISCLTICSLILC
jgi:hypothetical protein